MDIIAIAISIISLIASIVLACKQTKSSFYINDINLEAELSKDTFKIYLTEKIPKAISNISFDGNRLTNIDELQDALNSFRNDLVYFKYLDEVFYNDFKNAAQNLEDYIVKNEGKTVENTDIANILQEIVEKIKVLYAVCRVKYKRG